MGTAHRSPIPPSDLGLFCAIYGQISISLCASCASSRLKVQFSLCFDFVPCAAKNWVPLHLPQNSLYTCLKSPSGNGGNLPIVFVFIVSQSSWHKAAGKMKDTRRVFIKDHTNCLYLTINDQWSLEVDQARNFRDILSAIDFCSRKNLKNVYILLEAEKGHTPLLRRYR